VKRKSTQLPLTNEVKEEDNLGNYCVWYTS